MIKIYTLIFTIVFSVVQMDVSFAQENAMPGVKNFKNEFSKARELAFNGQREDARTICYALLKEKPNFTPARILIGRTFSWDKKYDEARLELQKVLDLDFDNKDAILASIDCEKWSGELSKALYYCDYGLSFYPREEKIIIKKIGLLQDKGLESKSLQAINELLEINPASSEGIRLFKKYKSGSRRYTLALKHDFEHFKEPYIRRWHVTSLQVSRKNSWGSLIGKVNVGDLVSGGESLWSKEVSKQFELDAYPRVTRTSYMYLNYGYSPDNLFPEHRAGAEWYQKLPSKFEASAGIRFMKFNGSSGSKNVYIYTGSIGKYYRHYWFSLRGYFTPKNSKVSKSFLLTTRRYLSDAKQYIGVEAGLGTSPDEFRGNTSNFETYTSDSYKLRLAYQDQFLDKRFTYLLRAGIEKEEYRVNDNRNILSLSIKLSYNL